MSQTLFRRLYNRQTKKGLIINSGIAAVGMFAATALAAKAMMPDANLVQTGLSAATLGVSLIPLNIAASRVVGQMGKTGARVFDALHKSPVGKVLGKVSAGTWGGALLGGLAMGYLGSSHMEIAGNLTNPIVWKYAAMPIVSVLGMAVVQRGMQDSMKREAARVDAAYATASAGSGRTRVNAAGMDTPTSSEEPASPTPPKMPAP